MFTSLSSYYPKSFQIFSPLLRLRQIKFVSKCLTSTYNGDNTNSLDNLNAWNFVVPPSENRVLFATLIEENKLISKESKNSSSSNEATNITSLRELVNRPDRSSFNVSNFHGEIIDRVKKGSPNCLRDVSKLLQSNREYLISLVAPFDDHFKFIRKLDDLLVYYCRGVRKDEWSKLEFINDCLQLHIDLYSFSPPTTYSYATTLVQNILGKSYLSKEQFLHLMFCCVLSRKQMSPHQVDWCYRFIDEHLDSLNLADLSLILVAFHKTQTAITDESLYKKILTKVALEASTERDATLRSSLIKGINYSLVMPDVKLSSKVVDSFLELDNLSIYNYIHLNEFCVKQKLYCPKLINKSIGILENAVEHLREKDVERILKCATAFEHLQPPCPNIDEILQQLDARISQSTSEDMEKTIPSLLRSAFLLNIYPSNMINYILSNDWLKKLNFYGPDIHLFYWLLMTIRDCLLIDRSPEYDGKLQNLDSVFNKGSAVNKLRIPIRSIIAFDEGRTNMNNRNLGLLYRALSDAFPDRFVQLGYILSTSLTPDLILTTESKHIRLLKGPIRKPNCFVKAYVIVYQGKQMYMDQRFIQISGHYRLRERLFEKLGLTVINIPFFEFYHKTDEYGGNDDLVDYLKRRINQLES